MQRAKVGIWHGALQFGSTGVEAADGWLAFSVCEIPAAPDFSSYRFPDLTQLDEAQRIKRVSERQAQFLAALHKLGAHFSVTLRYVYEREALDREGRIRLFLLGRCFGETEGAALSGIEHYREFMQRTFPAEYSMIDLPPYGPNSSVAEAVLNLDGISSITEILKPEQAVGAWHDPAVCGFSFHYHPLGFTLRESNDMVELCRALTRDGRARRAVVDLCLMPTATLTLVEQEVLKEWAIRCETWGRDQRRRVGGGLYSEPTNVEIEKDPYADRARQEYEKLLQRYGSAQTKCFVYAFRVMWDEVEPPHSVAAALASQVLANNDFQLCAVSSGQQAFAKALNAARFGYATPAICRADIWQHPEAPETLRRLHRLVDINEAAGFFRLPIPGRDGCPGFPLDTGLTATASPKHGVETNIVKLGNVIDGSRETAEPSVFPLNDLTKHCLIVGTPGSGKTTLCFSLLTQLWQEHGIPFIVLEPAKTEYRTLKELDCFRDDLIIFSVGNERVSPFRFNPFEVLEGFSVSEHISALSTCFSGAFDLFGPLPMIFDQAVREVYAERGWSEYGVGGEDPECQAPTLEDFFVKTLAVAKSKSYSGEFAGNMRGALETRIGSLLRGPKGRCFNTRQSVPTALLMNKPVIFELDALNDEEKALTMMFILTQVRAYAKVRPKSESGKSKTKLKHVLLVEEAHNVIGRGDGRTTEGHANPQGVAIRFFTRMLAEMRALGEGIIIADQLPTAIAPEAIKTTNIKVMHRLVSADDRAELGQTMTLDDGQIQQAALLPPGQSFVFREGEARAQLVKELNFKDLHDVGEPPDDEIVRELMAGVREQEEIRGAYLPYDGCNEACRFCDTRIREQNERWVERKRQSINQALEENHRFDWDPVGAAITCFFEGLKLKPDEHTRRSCAIIHFSEKIAKHMINDKKG